MLGSKSVAIGDAILLFSLQAEGLLLCNCDVVMWCSITGALLPACCYVVLFWLRVCRNKNAAAAAAKSEMLAKVQRAEQILEAQQKRYALRSCILSMSGLQVFSGPPPPF